MTHTAAPLWLATRHALLGAVIWEFMQRVLHTGPRRSAVRQFERNLRDYGLRVALSKSIAHIMSGVYETRVYRIYRIDLCKWTVRADPKDGIDYYLVKSTDDDLIGRIEQIEEWLDETLKSRIAEGAMCVVALAGHNIAGFNLVSFGRIKIPLICSKWVLAPGHAWSDQITVVPSFRGRGIASGMRLRVFWELKARGIMRFYGGTQAMNTVSLGLARKVGFREIVEVHFQKVLGHSSRHYFRLRTQPLEALRPTKCN